MALILNGTTGIDLPAPLSIEDGGTGNTLGAQAPLVSGTNIKTVNSTPLLGAGDVAVQPTLVSGTNIKTVGGFSLLGSGDIPIDVYSTGDVVISSDLAKYPSPQWLECTGSSFDRTAYPELGAVLGFSGSSSAKKLQEVISCTVVLDKFSNYDITDIDNVFPEGDKVAFNNDLSVAAIYISADTVHVFRVNTETGKYEFKQVLTLNTSIKGFAISSSGNYLAYTTLDSQACFMLKWNGVAYAGTVSSSASYGPYGHTAVAFSDDEAFIYFSTDSQAGSIYTVTTNGFGTLCGGATPQGISGGRNVYWLPNQNILVTGRATLNMYSVTGTTVATVGTAISNVSTASGGVAFSLDRQYAIVRKTTSPYTEIYKVAGTGFTSIYSDVTNANSALLYFDENRAIRIVGNLATTQTVYSINTGNDSVTNLGSAFVEPFYSSYDSNNNKWDAPYGAGMIQTVDTAGYLVASHVYSSATFKWDATSSKYLAYCRSIRGAPWTISYNTTREYGVVNNNQGAAYLLSINPTTLLPVPGSLKYIQYPAILNSSTLSKSYFTSCPNMFVCIQYQNPNIYSLDLLTGVFTLVTHNLNLYSSTTSYSNVQISPTGEFIVTSRPDDISLVGVYRNTNGTYSTSFSYTNGTNIYNVGQWLTDSTFMFDDVTTTSLGVGSFTSLTSSLTRSTLSYVQYFKDSVGRIFYATTGHDYYVKYPDNRTELLVDAANIQTFYVSDDGEFVQIGTNGYVFNAVLDQYVLIGTCALQGIASGQSHTYNAERVFDKNLGIIRSASGYTTHFSNNLPSFTPSTVNMENKTKSFIKTGVV